MKVADWQMVLQPEKWHITGAEYEWIEALVLDTDYIHIAFDKDGIAKQRGWGANNTANKHGIIRACRRKVLMAEHLFEP